MSDFQLNIPICKVDEEQRIVYGYATQEIVDRQGDIVDYEASKKAFSKWPGNIREQHDSKRAVGKNVHLEFDDAEKRILIGAKISESTDGQNALIKVKEGILTGFSIGGKIFKTIRETFKSEDGSDKTANRIMDYDLAEVSLVDVPACPTAQFVLVKSADGVLEAIEEMHETTDGLPLPWFMKSYAYSLNQNPNSTDNTIMSKQSKETTMADADKVEIEKVNVQAGEERNADAEVVVEATVEKVNVQGGEERDANAEVVETVEEAEVVEDKKPAKKADETVEAKVEEPDTKKGLYSVANLADCVANLMWIVSDAEWEAMYDGEKSGAAAQLRAAASGVADALVALTTEAVAELKAGDDVALSTSPADLQKMVDQKLEATQPDLIKSVVEAVTAKVAEQFAPLEERLKAIESQPAGQAPVRSYTVVDKVADAEPVVDEYQTLIAKADALGPDASPSERAALAGEMMKAKSRQRPIPAVTIN